MTANEQNLAQELQWKKIYLLGGIAATLCIGGTLFDIVFGSISSSNLAALPQDATGSLAMLELARKYQAAVDTAQRTALLAVALAAPGGILSLVWLVLVAFKLLKMSGLQIHIRAASTTH